MSVPVVLVDPLSLVGRELVDLLASRSDLDLDLRYLHTAEDDEHQVTELEGAPALVPPLSGPEDLDECAAVVVASDRDRPRLAHVEAFLDRSPEVPLLDCGRSRRLRRRTRPTGHGGDATNGRVHRRVAHPAAVMAQAVVEALGYLSPASLALLALEPASHDGDDGVELLASQAVSRLRGERPTALLQGQVLAFSSVAVEQEMLAEDAGALLAGLPVTVSRLLTGAFHGHVAQLVLGFDDPIEPADVLDALSSGPVLQLADHPLALDTVTGSDQILVATPETSADGRVLAITSMADGLRIGGAVTAASILRTLL